MKGTAATSAAAAKDEAAHPSRHCTHQGGDGVRLEGGRGPVLEGDSHGHRGVANASSKCGLFCETPMVSYNVQYRSTTSDRPSLPNFIYAAIDRRLAPIRKPSLSSCVTTLSFPIVGLILSTKFILLRGWCSPYFTQ